MRSRALALSLLLSVSLAGCTGDPDASARDLEISSGDALVPYLQQGADAARTGATADPGPDSFDLAFSASLPGTRWREVVPVVLDDEVFLLISVNDPAIWRLDLTTGEAEPFVGLNDTYWTSTFFSDGRNLFVGQGNEILAFRTTDGAPAWEEPYRFPQVLVQPARATNCMPGAFANGLLYLGCTQLVSDPDAPVAETPSFGIRPESAVVAVALDAATGDEVWRTVLYPQLEDAQADASYRPHRILVRTALGPERFYVQGAESFPQGYTVSPDGSAEAQMRQVVWAFSRDDGGLGWNWRAPPHTVGGGLAALFDPERYQEARDRDLISLLDMGMVATPDALYLKADRLHALDPGSGAGIWELPLHQPDDSPRQSYGLAFFDDDLYVTSHAHLYRVDAIAQSIDWSVRAAPGDDWDDTLGLLVANGAVYGVTDQGRLSVHDIEDGSIIHQRRIGPEQTTTDAYVLAVGAGVAVASRNDGEVLVFGRPPAAIHPRASASSAYPAPGETVRLDLSATRPGALADDLAYQVNWGDGTLTAWQTDPVFTHAFPRAAEQSATLRMRNSAGQEASHTMAFHVGGTPPRSPTLLETAFARENQDLTFGVLGLVVALAGGLVALGWRYTKRSRLQRELHAIDRAYERTRHDPVACEATLEEHKVRCRRLLLTGRLEEPQFAVLENRIHELSRGLRLSALDDRFDFLPHGLVKALRDMLSDGRISDWERQHVLGALEQDDVLTKRQKQKVRAQVDSWFERDTGATR